LAPLPSPQDFIHKDEISKVRFVKKLHERVRKQIQHQIERHVKQNNKGKMTLVFEEGDCDGIRHNHLSQRIKGKELEGRSELSRRLGPFKPVWVSNYLSEPESNPE